MGLPAGLKKIGNVVTSKPRQPVTPEMPDWEPTSRVDGVTIHRDEAADLFYSDGLTEPMRAGIEAQFALEEAKTERKRQQHEAAAQASPAQQPFQGSSFQVSPAIEAAFRERFYGGDTA